jgi:hypothetical protein
VTDVNPEFAEAANAAVFDAERGLTGRDHGDEPLRHPVRAGKNQKTS